MAPSTLSLEFTLGADCMPTGSRTVLLNGTSIGTFNSTYTCACTTQAITTSSFTIPAGVYTVGGTNTITIQSTACEGLELTSGAFATVNVTYPHTNTYSITDSAALTNLAPFNSTCASSDPNYYSSDCANNWGFSWTDTDTMTPSSLTVGFTLGADCMPTGSRNLLLNGTNIGTFNSTDTCACTTQAITTTSLTIPGGVYTVGGTNTITVESNACEGLELTSGSFATVSVSYP